MFIIDNGYWQIIVLVSDDNRLSSGTSDNRVFDLGAECLSLASLNLIIVILVDWL